MSVLRKLVEAARWLWGVVKPATRYVWVRIVKPAAESAGQEAAKQAVVLVVAHVQRLSSSLQPQQPRLAAATVVRAAN